VSEPINNCGTAALLGIGANITMSLSVLSPAASSTDPCAVLTTPANSAALLRTGGVASKFDTRSVFLVVIIISSYYYYDSVHCTSTTLASSILVAPMLMQ